MWFFSGTIENLHIQFIFEDTVVWFFWQNPWLCLWLTRSKPKVALRNETLFLSYQLIFHSFKFNIFNPLCWHSMSDTLTSYSSPFLFHSSLKYFEGGFGKEIPNAILNGTSWDCKIPLTNIFLLLAFLYFMILSLLSSQLLSYILVDLILLSKWLKWLATLQYQGGVEY